MSVDFDAAFDAATHSRRFAPALRHLLHAVFDRLNQDSVDLAALRLALEELFVFLASPTGRTDANCSVTDYFFSAAGTWARSWLHLPAGYQTLLNDLGGTLHDTVYAANIARTFETLPEQLLIRIRALED